MDMIITINKFSRISDWFASNISLLVLAVVVLLFSSTYNFAFFVSYNPVCTICNLLFVIILIKHKFVTRYVFYITGAPNENIVQNHLNMALLNVF